MIGVTNNIARCQYSEVYPTSKKNFCGISNFSNIFFVFSIRIGRVPVLIISVCGVNIFKFLSSFSISYEMFVALTFFDAAASSAIYPTTFILGMEWASAKNRILVSAIIMIGNPFGSIVTATVAAYTHNYKWMLRIISLPCLLIIVYIWLARESLRWLLVKKKYDRAMETVARATKLNKIEPSPRTFSIISEKCNSDGVGAVDITTGHFSQLKTVVTSSQLRIRFVLCIIGWISCIFIIYGMSIVSLSLPGDKYWNISFVSLSTFPAIFSSYFMLSYMKRRCSLCLPTVLTGLTIIASYSIGHLPTLSLIFFFFFWKISHSALGDNFIRVYR